MLQKHFECVLFTLRKTDEFEMGLSILIGSKVQGKKTQGPVGESTWESKSGRKEVEVSSYF